MGEEWIALEAFHHRSDAIVATDSKIVALGHIVQQNDPTVVAEASDRGQDRSDFEVLAFSEDDDAVGESAASDMGERKDLEEFPVADLIDDVITGDRSQRIKDRSRPWTHLFVLGAG